MRTPYPIIIGLVAHKLHQTHPNCLAYARVGAREVYCGNDSGRNTGILHWNDSDVSLVALNPEDTVLARRIFINFDAMHDNEIDARYHALKSMRTSGGLCRVESVDPTERTINWTWGGDLSEERTIVTPWTNKQQLLVSTTAYDEVDMLCNKYRISLTCNEDLGEVIQWTASSPHFKDECGFPLEMVSPSRSRAVIQLVLWDFYLHTPHNYIGRKEVEKILSSHAIEV